jgi:sugar/nucleoside kinase (ribokinase family)
MGSVLRVGLRVTISEIGKGAHKMADVLVVGSVAFDSIATPSGSVERALGGSATYFSLACSHFARPHVVAVVGEDFGPQETAVLEERGVDLAGLDRAPGKTFHWSGSYLEDLNRADTIATDLNVFATFSPTLPVAYRSIGSVFLGNIDPDLQLHVLSQMEAPRLVALDTMNFWIGGKRAALREVLRRVDVLLVNEGEAKLLAETDNLRKAARLILHMGPRHLVVKRGEYGVAMFREGAVFAMPGYPLEDVVDPTGAGDSFAGGFVGSLCRDGHPGDDALRRACLHGTAVASFTVEDFGVKRLRAVRLEDVASRAGQLMEMVRL